ncbi:helix-turn-helix transcriptional regulator [Victivallis vadensis]|uniref:helix-turn-helix transcriptional regulator n=1 Tax=Victivallis vadensis TaxID=172901 RepID=UPI003D00E3BE
MRALSGYSPVYFDRLFRQHTSQTPHRFLAELRMRKAVDLLENTLLSVKEVAERCRFRDSAYFCRAFRRAFGRRPGDFRCRRDG